MKSTIWIAIALSLSATILPARAQSLYTPAFNQHLISEEVLDKKWPSYWISAPFEKKGEMLDNVKIMATWILERNVLNITYIDKKNKEHKEIFHPQYLREYNNRWAVYGKCEGIEEYPTCIRIDSIVELSLLIKEEGIIYQEAERHYYRDYFKDMIGFTKNKNSKVQNVYFLTNNQEVHNLIKTKPFHESQEELEAWSNETQHGKFVLHIIPNIELRTKLLSYGSGITLEGNGWFQRGFKEEIKKMAELYKNEE